MTKTVREVLAEYGDTHRNRAYDFDNGDLTEAEGEELDLDNDGDIAKSLTPVRNGITGEPL